MDYKEEIIYWKRFNVAARIVGFLFLIVGLWSCYLGITAIINSYLSSVVLTDEDYITAFVPLIFALVGFFAMRLEPYLPEHIKRRMQEEKDDKT